jgi:hypothetical protein
LVYDCLIEFSRFVVGMPHASISNIIHSSLPRDFC